MRRRFYLNEFRIVSRITWARLGVLNIVFGKYQFSHIWFSDYSASKWRFWWIARRFNATHVHSYMLEIGVRLIHLCVLCAYEYESS